MRSLEGRTAIITGGGTRAGRAIALALSARGVRIVVTGRDEKALGETVGEVVYGGGKARHLAGDPSDVAHLAAAVERATSVFGPLHIAVIADAASAEIATKALAPRLVSPGRLLVAVTDRGAASSLVSDLAGSLSIHGVTCNAIVIDASAEEDAADDAAELAVHLCSDAGERITGQSVAVGHAVRIRTEA